MRNHLFGLHPTRRLVISLTRMRSLEARICESSTADIGIRARARQSAARGLSRPQRSLSSSNSVLKNLVLTSLGWVTSCDARARGSPLPAVDRFSLLGSLRFSLRHVRSRPRLGHRGRVTGREWFVERVVDVRILIGRLRLGLGFLVHRNFSGSPFRNQPWIAVGGRIIPPFLSCENARFTISKSALLDAPAIHIFALPLQGRPQRYLATTSERWPSGSLSSSSEALRPKPLPRSPFGIMFKR